MVASIKAFEFTFKYYETDHGHRERERSMRTSPTIAELKTPSRTHVVFRNAFFRRDV